MQVIEVSASIEVSAFQRGSAAYKLTLSPRKFLKHSPRNGSKTKQVHRTFLAPQCTVPLLTPPSILSGINHRLREEKRKGVWELLCLIYTAPATASVAGERRRTVTHLYDVTVFCGERCFLISCHREDCMCIATLFSSALVLFHS